MATRETKKDTRREARPGAPGASAAEKEMADGGDMLPLAEALGGGLPGGAKGEWEPSMDWLMGSLGPFFNNNQGIGELLLDKLKESGVNTEGVALAGLVNVLQQFSKELKSLNDSVGDNLQRINELSSENENLSQQLQEIVGSMGLTKDDGGAPPMDGLGGADAGLPPAGDMGASPAGDMGGGMDAGLPPAGDMGGGMDAGLPPAGDMGASPAGDMGGGMDAGVPGMPPGGVMSDEKMKQKVLSDRRMKRLARSMVRQYAKRRSNSVTPSSGIVSACMEGC